MSVVERPLVPRGTGPNLVQRAGTGEDDRVALVLDGALAVAVLTVRTHRAPRFSVMRGTCLGGRRAVVPEANEVGTDADRAAGDQRDRKDVAVRVRRLARNEARAPQVLHADAVGRANDVGDHVALLAVLHHELGAHRGLAALREHPVVRRREVQVLEACRSAQPRQRVLSR